MATNKPVTIKIAGDSALFKKSIKSVEKSLKGLKKVGIAAGVGMAAGIAGAGVGILKLGSTFEDVNRTLRVGTGATGEALEALTDITRNLALKVPMDFQSIGTAVADINTRLGLTGKELEDFSQQMLDLSRITGEDLQGNIKAVSRVVGDWGEKAGDAEDATNLLYNVAQSTGITFQQLSRNLVAYGAPLRQVGFTFEQSAVLIGKFEKEGVNAELVLGSLRQALGKMAREGEPAIETFKRVVEEIENAGDSSEANLLALTLFGARAGPDMAASIREGRFALEEYSEIMAGGGDTIAAAASETETLREKLTLLKNRVLVTIAPVVEKAFASIVRAFERVKPHVEKLIERFKEFTESKRFEEIKRSVEKALTKIAEVIEEVIGKVRKFARENPEAMFAALAVVVGTVLVGAVVALISALGVLLSPVILVVAAVAALTAGVVYAWQEFEIFRDVVHAVMDFFTDTVWPALDSFFENIKAASKVLADFFQTYVQPIIEAAIGAVMAIVDSLWQTISAAYDLIRALFEGDMAAVWEAFKDMAAGAVGLIVDVFINLPLDIMKAAAPLAGKFALIVADFAVNLVGKIVTLIQGIPDKIVELIGAVASDVIAAGLALGGNIVSGIVSAISGAGSAIWNAVRGAMEDFVPDWLPGWLNPFGGDDEPSVDPTSGRRVSSRRRTTGASVGGTVEQHLAGLPGLKGGTGIGAYTVVPSTGFGSMVIALDRLNESFAAGGVAHPSASISIPWDPDSPFGAPSQAAIDTAVNLAIIRHGLNGVPVVPVSAATTNPAVVVNIQGDVLSEELVDRIRVGLLEAQNSGKQLVV